ncbi:MAG: NHL repeat-containing protein [Candidatus Micrarchaeota archaeon]|nr:NHL repeat-containing protein [Candidatus Micrarchaeota archaeon]
MGKFLHALIALLLLFSIQSASFTYLYSLKGNNSADFDNYYQFSQPSGLLVLNSTLFVADSGKSALYLFNGTNRQKVLLSADSDSLTNPMRMTYADGMLYIADGTSGKIKTFTGVGYQISLWTASITNIDKASGIALDADNAYITDMIKKTLVVYSRSTRAYSRVAVQAGESDGQLSSPADVELYKGKFYISDSAKGIIFTYDSNFTSLASFGRGKGGISLTSPQGITIYNDRIYVADRGAGRVVAFSMDGYPLDVLNSSVFEGNISYPEDVAVADGKLYVTDSGNRLVKVFQINESVDDGAVSQKVALADNAVFDLLQLDSIASKLNLTAPSESTLTSNLALAKTYLAQYDYNSASTLAQSVIDGCSAEASTLAPAIELKTKQIVKSAQDKVAPYRQYATGSTISTLVQFDNKASLVNLKLSSKAYSDAADTALSLGPIADTIISQTEIKVAEQQERARDETKAALLSSLASFDSRLSAIEADSAAYQQNANTSNVRVLIASAKEQIANNDFASANHSIALVGIEVVAFESTFAAQLPEIKKALSAIALDEASLNSTVASQPPIFNPDFSPERAMMLQAYGYAYSNPQLAISLSKQAKDATVEKASKSQTVYLAATATLAIIGLIVIIAAAFYLYIRRMKSKSR